MYTFQKLFVVAALVLTTAVGYAQKKENPCNPCGKKKEMMKENPCNPCGKKAENPCNPCGKMSKGWSIDPAHSAVMFSVKHLVFSDVTGKFKDFTIDFSATKDDFSDAMVSAKIMVSSISTDNEKRDTHLKSDDFFNAEKYPEITFKSTKFERVAKDQYKIIGDLTIRGITRRVVFDATLNGSMKTPMGTLYAWKATTAINRFDFGLKWNMAVESGGLIAGETVNIVLNLELNKAS
jgi:polyisoprenoid-binding protein YceI